MLNLNRFKQRHKTYLAATLFTCGFSLYASSPLADSVIHAEEKLLSGLASINEFQLDQAIGTFSELGSEFPKYKLAHLISADLLAMRSGQTALMQKVHNRNPKSVSKLLDEAHVRWQFSNGNLAQPSQYDDYILKSANQKHLLLVSLQESRLYLFSRNEKGEMFQEADYYVTMGRKGSGKQREGDLRTPVGVYHMVDLLPGKDLPDLYGVGALPLNYPNEWDKKQGKTGSGIWLHGVPSDTYIRPPKSSRGCVVLNNDVMERLLQKFDLPFSTPVVIVDENVSNLAFKESKKSVLSNLKAWLADNHHTVSWEQVSVYRYPKETDLYYVTFPGSEGDNLIHQFWQRDASGEWHVVVESVDPIREDDKKKNA